MRLPGILLLACLSTACGGAAPAPRATDGADLDRAARWLTGRFDSSAQAAADPEFKPVHLTACPVRVDGLGSHVLYVEQAILPKLDQPYRQRLYVLREEGGRVLSEVLGLADPKASVGRCDRPELPPLTAADAERKEGCVVELRWDGAAFVGGTQGQGCPSTHRGAVRTTTEVRISAEGLHSLDRGWDAQGQQVWGSTRGAYQFVREGGPAAP